RGPRGGQLAREQVVTGVAVLDVHDVACGPQTGDLVGENELGRHGCSSLASASRARVGEQSHLAGVLDGLGDLALFLDGDTGDPKGADVDAVGDELAQQRGVPVVDRPNKVEDLERAGVLLNHQLANLSLGYS